jgi:anaerobic magnesium-protoporphyrin IX monomethyl ester cyclase
MKAKRILLIEPPFYRLIKKTYALCRYPLSLGYLACAIEKSTDWDVMVYNADFLPAADPFEVCHLAGEGFASYRRNLQDPSNPIWREIRERIVAFDPAVVGISVKSSTFASAEMVARIAKELDPKIYVIVGGPHPSSVGTQILDYPHIDMGVAGEGEQTLPELLRYLEIKSGVEWTHVQGILCRMNGHAVATPQRPLVSDLDELGFPGLLASRVLMDFDQYPAEAFRSVLATRGCPNNCFYCGSRNVWGRTVRFRSPENVVEEIQSLRGMGIQHIHFEDDTFGVNATYLLALCREIENRCPEVQWSCETHVNTITNENVSIMKKAGCSMIQLGIESGSNRILREIRKGFSIDKALNACEIIRGHEIALETFFMIGLPQETEGSLRETLRAVEQVECNKVIYSIFTPYPGTEAFEWCKSKGLIGSGYDLSLHHHQSPVNNFCAAIPHDVFRSMASEIEQRVDQKNRLARCGKSNQEAVRDDSGD